MSETIPPRPSTFEPRRRGFTLIEILVVIGIIVILISILVPVVSRVRRAARVAAIQAQINSLEGAIRQYQQDHNALPGPLSYNQIRQTSPSTLEQVSAVAAAGGGTLNAKFTMAENLVLGLLGGLQVTGTAANPTYEFDPMLVGAGPRSLNIGAPKTYRAYLEKINLSSGDFADQAGGGDDSIVPEFVDVWPTPMPILYLRARKGVQTVEPPAFSQTHNPVITDVPNPGANGALPQRDGQYDMSQILGYLIEDATGFIGEEKDISVGDYTGTPPAGGKLRHGLTSPIMAATLDKGDATNYEYPYNAFPYFKNPASSSTAPEARNKDGFILISAGPDRVYGTADDITNFGSVAP